jgi:hypothetical protein
MFLSIPAILLIGFIVLVATGKLDLSVIWKIVKWPLLVASLLLVALIIFVIVDLNTKRVPTSASIKSAPIASDSRTVLQREFGKVSTVEPSDKIIDDAPKFSVPPPDEIYLCKNNTTPANNIHLGDDIKEVLYKLGKPNYTPKSSSTFYLYRSPTFNGGIEEFSVYFNKNNKVFLIGKANGYDYRTPTLLYAGNTAILLKETERQVINALGSPASVEYNEETKIIKYDLKPTIITIMLARGVVTGASIQLPEEKTK